MSFAGEECMVSLVLFIYFFKADVSEQNTSRILFVLSQAGEIHSTIKRPKSEYTIWKSKKQTRRRKTHNVYEKNEILFMLSLFLLSS